MQKIGPLNYEVVISVVFTLIIVDRAGHDHGDWERVEGLPHRPLPHPRAGHLCQGVQPYYSERILISWCTIFRPVPVFCTMYSISIV